MTKCHFLRVSFGQGMLITVTPVFIVSASPSPLGIPACTQRLAANGVLFGLSVEVITFGAPGL